MLPEYCQSGQVTTSLLSQEFLGLNVWLSIISCLYWPSEFLFPGSYLCSWLQVTCVLCLEKKSSVTSPIVSSSYVLCLFPLYTDIYIRPCGILFLSHIFQLLVFSLCLQENAFHHYLANIQLAFLKMATKCGLSSLQIALSCNFLFLIPFPKHFSSVFFWYVPLYYLTLVFLNPDIYL